MTAGLFSPSERTMTTLEHWKQRAERAEAERDAALAQAAYLQQEYDEAHNVIEAGLERESAALAQVEGLRTIRSLCRGCLKPMKEHPPGPPCPPFLPGPLRAAGSALFRLVDVTLASTPAPAVYTRERLERAWKAAYRGFRSSCTWTSTGNAFWGTLGEKAPPHPDEDDQNEALREEWLKPALDAHPDAKGKP